MFNRISQSSCGSSLANLLVIGEDSPMKSIVLLFSSLEGSCRSPVKFLHRRESFGLFVCCMVVYV